MTTTFKSLVALFIFIGLRPPQLTAQEIVQENRTTFSVETDPSTFLFNGYAVHLRVKPKNSAHFVIGAGAYALDMPDMMVDMNRLNRNQGWHVSIHKAFSLFGEYYFEKASHKWFVGLQAGIQQYKNTNKAITNKESKYNNVLLMPSVGYNWQPFKWPLSVKPWFGMGYTSKISGNSSIDHLTYNIAPLIPFVTLHLGYTF